MKVRFDRAEDYQSGSINAATKIFDDQVLSSDVFTIHWEHSNSKYLTAAQNLFLQKDIGFA